MNNFNFDIDHIYSKSEYSNLIPTTIEEALNTLKYLRDWMTQSLEKSGIVSEWFGTKKFIDIAEKLSELPKIPTATTNPVNPNAETLEYQVSIKKIEGEGEELTAAETISFPAGYYSKPFDITAVLENDTNKVLNYKGLTTSEIVGKITDEKLSGLITIYPENGFDYFNSVLVNKLSSDQFSLEYGLNGFTLNSKASGFLLSDYNYTIGEITGITTLNSKPTSLSPGYYQVTTLLDFTNDVTVLGSIGYAEFPGISEGTEFTKIAISKYYRNAQDKNALTSGNYSINISNPLEVAVPLLGTPTITGITSSEEGFSFLHTGTNDSGWVDSLNLEINTDVVQTNLLTTAKCSDSVSVYKIVDLQELTSIINQIKEL